MPSPFPQPGAGSLTAAIDTFQGTDSQPDFSRGNTLPLTTLPHGMVGWIPQTDPGRWPFSYRARDLQGFRATHQPSPWIGDYGNFLVMVGSGRDQPVGFDGPGSPYLKDETVARPHYFRTRLVRDDVVVEIAPTERGVRASV
jgi:putative alpha-1,2-mannosidase